MFLQYFLLGYVFPYLFKDIYNRAIIISVYTTGYNLFEA